MSVVYVMPGMPTAPVLAAASGLPFPILTTIVLLPVLLMGFGHAGGGPAEGPSAAAYDSIQAAIDGERA